MHSTDLVKIVESRKASLLAYGVRITGDRAAAEDAYQIVLARVADKPIPEEAVLKYFRSALHNECIEERRRWIGRRHGLPTDLRTREATHARIECHRLLSKLDDRGRLVVEMRHFGGYTDREIATQLGLRENHVPVIVRRAFARLRARL